MKTVSFTWSIPLLASHHGHTMQAVSHEHTPLLSDERGASASRSLLSLRTASLALVGSLAICGAYAVNSGAPSGMVNVLGAVPVEYSPHAAKQSEMIARLERRVETPSANVGSSFSNHLKMRSGLARRISLGQEYHGDWTGYQGYGSIPRVPPQQTVAAGNNPSNTFSLMTQCKTEEVKYLNPEFWFSPIAAAYIVRHNYGTSDFFSMDGALRMDRRELSDGLYGYSLTTDQVDFEYGYALENKRGEVWYEIGAVPAPLFGENCAQMYGSYYNRIAPQDPEKTFVFGSCAHACPSDYRDAAYCTEDLTDSISEDAAAPSNLGPVDDARLISINSVMMVGDPSILEPSARVECKRDGEGNADEAKWTCGQVDEDASKIKMIGLTIRREAGDATLFQSYSKAHTFNAADATAFGYDYVEGTTHDDDGTCKYASCSASRYPMGAIAAGSPDFPGLRATRIDFNRLAFGDAPPEELYAETNDPFLLGDDYVLLAPGTWGEDMDVRRVVMKNAAMCGEWLGYGKCIMTSVAFADLEFTPTKFEKRWIFSLINDQMIKMVRVSVTYDESDGSVHARAMDARRVDHTRDPNDYLTSDSLAFDMSEKFHGGIDRPVAECFDFACEAGMESRGYGIGGLKYLLAPEMSLSLKGNTC